MMKKRLFAILLMGLLTLTAFSQSTQELRDSLSTLIRQLNYHQNDVDMRLRKASLNMQLEQWQYAIDEYTAILKLDEGNLTALRYRAYAYERVGLHQFARVDYEAVLKVIPDNFEALLGMALLNQKEKRVTMAMDQINRLVELYPDSAIAYAARAGIELERKMPDLSEYDFGEAIRLDPTNADYIISRAEVRIALGRKREAREDLQRALSLGISYAEIANLLKRCR